MARTKCRHGHPFTADNTYVAPTAGALQECRQCKRDRSRERYHGDLEVNRAKTAKRVRLHRKRRKEENRESGL